MFTSIHTRNRGSAFRLIRAVVTLSIILSVFMTAMGKSQTSALAAPIEDAAIVNINPQKGNSNSALHLTHPTPRTGNRPQSSLKSDAAQSQEASLMFVENVGQFDPQARFQVKTVGATIFLANDAVWVSAHKLLDPEINAAPIMFPALPAYEGVNLRFRSVGYHRFISWRNRCVRFAR